MMKFGQWGDRPAKEDGSFSFAPVNVVNSTAHTAPSALIKEEGRSCRAVEGLGFWGVVVVMEVVMAVEVGRGEMYRARKGVRGCWTWGREL